MDKRNVTFDDISEQNKLRFYYHTLSRLDQNVYQESIFATLQAYKTHQLDKGPLATYFNYIIRNRACDLICTQTTRKIKDSKKRITYRSEAAFDQMKVAEEPLTLIKKATSYTTY